MACYAVIRSPGLCVARCVALYGRRRYFLYKYQSAAFAACVASSDVVRRSWWRSVNACGVSDPAAVPILSRSAGRPGFFGRAVNLQGVRGRLDLSGVMSCGLLEDSVRRAVRSCCRLSVFRRSVSIRPGLIPSGLRQSFRACQVPPVFRVYSIPPGLYGFR